MQKNKRKTVLVIDDDRNAADLLMIVIRGRGHEAHVAYDSRTGLDLALQLTPDVIFYDVGMAHSGGYRVAQILRGQPQFDNTLLIALTEYGSEDDRMHALRAGFNKQLRKPASN